MVERPSTAESPEASEPAHPSIADALPLHATILDVSSRDGPFHIGRGASCDLVLDDLRVERRHARILKDERGLSLQDLSQSGVFVNGRRVESAALQVGDLLRIGPYRLAVGESEISWLDDDLRVGLEARGVRVIVGGKILLHDVSFAVSPAQRLAIAGPSGAGKSTLLDALVGLRAPQRGRIAINGIDLYQYPAAVQPLFGYTPQQNIVHRHLTVERALLYSARLRLPRDVSPIEAANRVAQVLQELELSESRGLEISRMSGGELKRVSIATELIANPGLLVLDEPTSALDPGLTSRLMDVVNALASAGRTIILATHDVETLRSCDMLIFLTSDGRLAFRGTPEEALTYFRVRDLANVYRRVETEDTTERWEQRFRESDLGRRGGDEDGEEAEATTVPSPHRVRAPGRPQHSFLGQLSLVVRRRAEILMRDRWNVLLLLLQSVAIGGLLALLFGHDAFDPVGAVSASKDRTLIGNIVPAGALATALPLILVASAVWFGAINAAREIVGELPVFARERQSGLGVLPYIASKVLVLGVLASVQVALMLAIVTLRVDVPRAGVFTYAIVEIYATLLLAAIAGEALGLLISASVSNADRAQSIVPIALVPQIIVSGGPLADRLAYRFSSLTITRWGVEAMKISVQIPYRGDAGFGGAALVGHWAVLVVMTVASFGAAALVLSLRKPRLR
ncbi:MAG TPA: ATP-binding cassette domain-containing protein [Dehalococcoidia bacterium]|nr:ATP-binding cassette domain-containing protein [Dehalococcoidia bacterium]